MEEGYVRGHQDKDETGGWHLPRVPDLEFHCLIRWKRTSNFSLSVINSNSVTQNEYKMSFQWVLLDTTTKTNIYSRNKATVTQPNICICYLDSSVLHTWVLSTLCKAYLEHTLPGVEKRPVCKVKLQLSISEGQHRLQAWVYRADQASWRTKASVSSGSSDQHTHTHIEMAVGPAGPVYHSRLSKDHQQTSSSPSLDNCS